MDYKLYYSQMESKINKDNFKLLNKNDVVKFVIDVEEELPVIKEIIERYDLENRFSVFFNTV
jgi:predicted ThiF/HesA family dinucleotide-utilizing enzyme